MKGVTADAITEVRSDAAHLEQCSHYLASMKSNPTRVMEWDSAGACKAVSGTIAAVASKEAAVANGLEVNLV